VKAYSEELKLYGQTGIMANEYVQNPIDSSPEMKILIITKQHYVERPRMGCLAQFGPGFSP